MTRDGGAGRVYDCALAVVGRDGRLISEPEPVMTVARSVADCCRCPHRACPVRGGMHRPDVLERLSAEAAVRAWSGRLRASAVGVTDRLDSAVGENHRLGCPI